MLGLTLVVFIVTIGIFAPLIARLTGHTPNQLFGNMRTQLGLPKGPTAHFWFGADQVGRDLFVRVIYGARTSLFVAVVGTGLATLLGIVVGLLSGYYGGRLDTVVSRVVDVWLSMPLLLFAVGLSTVCSASVHGCFGGLLQPGLPLVTGIIVLFTWPYLTRIVRGQVISLREREFVEAARSLGASDIHIMFSEVLPNLMAPILVYATLTIPGNILFEAALSFLGVGVPQSTPSWGRMLSDATSGSLFTYAWWMMVYPGLFLLLTTLAFYLVGDGVLDALDPRRRAR
ncbi:MAG: peptide/nickel transport system permease protein [Actinomycetota bacterium]|jgi:peptide/nickel transport system permease protein|nr:peptide/nickel transport system permease protein [Actinomycetota bacterium]